MNKAKAKDSEQMKKYRAIFFDWDGTAVVSRNSPADTVATLMSKLLENNILLLIISGTTYPNLCKGNIHNMFTKSQLKNLYFGLGRGSYNFSVNKNGALNYLSSPDIGTARLLSIHDTAYQIHRHLLEQYHYPTDIVFDRPNYCKIDLMTDNSRAESLYMTGNEIGLVEQKLQSCGWTHGISGLIDLSKKKGLELGLDIKATCDAKYLEVGVFNKSDNVNILMEKAILASGLQPEDCCFWGDEFLELDSGIWGSDSFMRTPQTQNCDFFDVGKIPGRRPEGVTHLGGGVPTFLQFLNDQLS